MVDSIRQIALYVPDLQSAETYYQRLFDMQVITREAELEDGLWYGLPLDKGWEGATQAGIEVLMVALQQGNLVLALFPGDPQPGQIYMIGLNVPLIEIAALRKRLSTDTVIWEDRPDALTFRDRFDITWQVYPTGTQFHGSGDQGRWLQV